MTHSSIRDTHVQASTCAIGWQHSSCMLTRRAWVNIAPLTISMRVGHDLFPCVTWLIHMHDLCKNKHRHADYFNVGESHNAYEGVKVHTWKSRVARICHSHEWVVISCLYESIKQSCIPIKRDLHKRPTEETNFTHITKMLHYCRCCCHFVI